jgi:transposase
MTLMEATHDFKKRYITAVLQRESWNVRSAAKVLGIHVNTVWVLVREFRIERPEHRPRVGRPKGIHTPINPNLPNRKSRCEVTA